MALRYPATIVPDGDGFMVTFPDVPEATTCGDSYEDALMMGANALMTAMDFYVEDGRSLPVPSVAVRGQVLIELQATVALDDSGSFTA